MNAMKRLIFLTLTFLSLTIGLFACAGGDSESPKLMTKAEARKVAEQAFKKEWGKTIAKYKISDPQDAEDKATWKFFFQGTGEFARPGYHVIVKVHKQTGQVEIIGGQ